VCIPSNAIPLLQELGDDVRASKARSTGNLDDGVDKFESPNRPKQETTGELTKTSLEAMSVRYGKKSMGVVGLSGGAGQI